MRIAVCFVGQLRSVLEASENIKRYLGELYNDCDFFVHCWDNITSKPYNCSNISKRPETVTQQILDFITNTYHPKLFVVDKYDQIEQEEVIVENGRAFKIFPSTPPQFYSLMKCVALKRQYEAENDFEYDYVLKLRTDIIFDEKRNLANEIDIVFEKDKSDFYIENVENPINVNAIFVDDVYYLSNSKGMDIAATYYKEVIKHMHPNGERRFHPYGYQFTKHLVENGLKIFERNYEVYDNMGIYGIYRTECFQFSALTEIEKCKECDNYYYNVPIYDVKKPKKYFIDDAKRKYKIDDTKKYYADELVLKEKYDGRLKIAVCLSGQPRTWRTAKENIKHYFDIPNADVYYFIHIWDTNTLRRSTEGITETKDTKITKEEADEIREEFNPTGFEFEEYSNERFRSRWESLYYSFMKSIWLKRKHELENDFQFDIVIKSRFDANFPLEGFSARGTKLDKFYVHKLTPLIAYTSSPHISKFPTEYNFNCFDDIFFYSDSPTMDIIANVYRWFRDVFNESSIKIANMQYNKNTEYYCGPGTILYRYLIKWGILPHGEIFVPYYLVRLEAEEEKLHSIKDWKRICEISKNWYNKILTTENE